VADFLDMLSSDDIRSLLVERLETADRRQMIEMLQGDSSANELSTNEAARVRVFEAVSPSVAFISTDSSDGSWWRRRVGGGSGFVWDADGHIVTNYHVIAGDPRRVRRGTTPTLPDKVLVKLHGQEESVKAAVVGHEADKDLAVLRVDPTRLVAPLRPVQLASSSELKVGQSVLAIGAPFGARFT